MRLLTGVLALALAAAAMAEETPASEQGKPAEPAIEKLADGRLRLGKIEFDPKSREIRFPSMVNMTEGLLEFLVVHEQGKIHESLLATDISALDLNVVLKLLHYQASTELYSVASSRPLTPEARQDSRLRIRLEWSEGDQRRTVDAHEWVSHAVTEAAMPTAPWIYGGSFVQEGRFLAETTGDLIAIYLSDASLINYAGNDNGNDEVWFPFTSRVPPIGTPVTVLLGPATP